MEWYAAAMLVIAILSFILEVVVFIHELRKERRKEKR
jgi:hypothetical protein